MLKNSLTRRLHSLNSIHHFLLLCLPLLTSSLILFAWLVQASSVRLSLRHFYHHHLRRPRRRRRRRRPRPRRPRRRRRRPRRRPRPHIRRWTLPNLPLNLIILQHHIIIIIISQLQ